MDRAAQLRYFSRVGHVTELIKEISLREKPALAPMGQNSATAQLRNGIPRDSDMSGADQLLVLDTERQLFEEVREHIRIRDELHLFHPRRSNERGSSSTSSSNGPMHSIRSLSRSIGGLT